jgi:hypothetical protein
MVVELPLEHAPFREVHGLRGKPAMMGGEALHYELATSTCHVITRNLISLITCSACYSWCAANMLSRADDRSAQRRRRATVALII